MLVLAVAAVAAGIAIGAGVGDDSEPPITGTALTRASEAALAHTGGGRVTETEAGDEESYYEVEVTLPDGSQVDVQLDRSFAVVGDEADGDESKATTTDREAGSTRARGMPRAYTRGPGMPVPRLVLAAVLVDLEQLAELRLEPLERVLDLGERVPSSRLLLGRELAARDLRLDPVRQGLELADRRPNVAGSGSRAARRKPDGRPRAGLPARVRVRLRMQLRSPSGHRGRLRRPRRACAALPCRLLSSNAKSPRPSRNARPR